MTQLVGRILRQPYAKKTGVAALDESYVFFTKGDTEKVLSNVRKGFSEEGLEGLFGNVKGGGGEASDPMVEKKVHIRKEVLTEYPESLFLPVWTIKHKGQSRRLSYEADILPRMRYDNFDAPVLVRDLIPALDDSTLTGREVRMSLGDAQEERSIELASNLSFDAPFLAWHLQEVIGNAFIAYEIAESILTAFSTAGVGQERLDAHAGLLASESVKRLKFHKETQERALFEEMLRDGLLSLMVSDQPYGFQLPREDAVTKGKKFRRSLYDETDISDLNDLERQVVEIVDKKESVIWWARNKVGREWYAIQGWRKGKFRPDFVIAKRDSAGKLEFVYITESKGEHLMGNFDTTYKTALFASMQDTEIEKDDPARSTLFAMNDRFEFEILNESDAVLKVNTKLR